MKNMSSLDIATAQQSLNDFQCVLQEARAFTNLVHGNVIALHCPVHNRFVRLMSNGSVDGYGGKMDADKIPLDWVSERFLVMKVGESQMAFYCMYHQRYICMPSDGGMVRAGTMKNLTDPIHESEIFDVLHDGKVFDGDGKFSLFSGKIGRHIRMEPSGKMDAAATVAKDWERYEVVLLMGAAPAETEEELQSMATSTKGYAVL